MARSLFNPPVIHHSDPLVTRLTTTASITLPSPPLAFLLYLHTGLIIAVPLLPQSFDTLIAYRGRHPHLHYSR